MSAPVCVAADDLKIGMYVSQLDRPWLETPFLFQGFCIRDQDEIAEIRRHCKFVYVDPVQSLTPAAELKAVISKPVPRPEAGAVRLRSVYKHKSGGQESDQIDMQATGTFYADTVSLKEEIEPARELRATAVSTISEVLQELRDARKLDTERLETVVNPLVDSVLRNQDALACLVRMKEKDDYLYGHSLGCAVWATILGRHIGLDKGGLQAIALGAMLLDIGKIRVPTELLVKPGALTAEETACVRQHVRHGLEIVDQSHITDSRVINMLEFHHERHNGTGYPNGARGNEIPVFGRIAGLVDSYDAMMTARPWAKPVPSFDAIRQFRAQADVDFQAEMVEQFIQAIGAFPTGTLVELNTGEVGVVVAQNQPRRLRPKVMVVLDESKKLRKNFPLIDLNLQTRSEDGRQSIWIERGLEAGAFGINPIDFYLG